MNLGRPATPASTSPPVAVADHLYCLPQMWLAAALLLLVCGPACGAFRDDAGAQKTTSCERLTSLSGYTPSVALWFDAAGRAVLVACRHSPGGQHGVVHRRRWLDAELQRLWRGRGRVGSADDLDAAGLRDDLIGDRDGGRRVVPADRDQRPAAVGRPGSAALDRFLRDPTGRIHRVS